MAINSAMPNERGLMLWSAWSAEDADYAADWSEDINPCEEPWYSFKSGGIGFGTLIWLADREDEDRRQRQMCIRDRIRVPKPIPPLLKEYQGSSQGLMSSDQSAA